MGSHRITDPDLDAVRQMCALLESEGEHLIDWCIYQCEGGCCYTSIHPNGNGEIHLSRRCAITARDAAWQGLDRPDVWADTLIEPRQ